MFENIETPCNMCIYIKDANKETINMANGKTINVSVIISELFKWTISSIGNWVMTIINQAIQQGLLNDWLMNLIKTIFKERENNQVSNYHTIMIVSTIAKLYSTMMEKRIIAWA